MNGTKHPLASMTLWGAIMLLVSFILTQFFGVTITPGEQAEAAEKIVGFIDAGLAVFGWIMVVIGRFKANKKVKI